MCAGLRETTDRLGALLELYLFFPKSLYYIFIYFSVSQKFNDLQTETEITFKTFRTLHTYVTSSLSLKEKSSSCEFEWPRKDMRNERRLLPIQ